MNKIGIAIFLIFSQVTLGASESADNLAFQFSARPRSEQKMENLPSGREDEVIKALYRWRDFHVLLRLNHAPTVDEVMTKFLSSQGQNRRMRRYIEGSGSPYLIPKLAPLLYKTDKLEPRTYGEHADSDYGEAAQAAEMIGELIMRAPEFSPESKKWADDHLGAPGPNIIRNARAWWELNQAALLANQLDQVRVPDTYPKPPSAEAATAAPVQLASQPVVAAPTEAARIETVPSTPPPPEPPAPPADPAPARPVPEKSSRPSLWLLCAAALALIVIVALVGIAKRKKSGA